MVEDDFLQLLVHLFLLTQNHVSLPFDRARLEFAVLKDVGEDVDGGWDVVVEGFGVVDGVFSAGVGVEMAAHVLDLEL